MLLAGLACLSSCTRRFAVIFWLPASLVQVSRGVTQSMFQVNSRIEKEPHGPPCGEESFVSCQFSCMIRIRREESEKEEVTRS